MLPECIRVDETMKSWTVLPRGATDRLQAIELFERKEDERDYVDENNVGHYFGEWIDRSEIVKAQYEVFKAEQELLQQEVKAYRDGGFRLSKKCPRPVYDEK